MTAAAAKPWEKLPAIESRHGAGPTGARCKSLFLLCSSIAVGFGYAGLLRDGEWTYKEPIGAESEDDYMSGAQAEALAAADPDHDWRIVMDAPLWGHVYQRHGPGEWALVLKSSGFA